MPFALSPGMRLSGSSCLWVRILSIAIISVLGASSQAASLPSDQQIGHLLVGSWIIPPEQTDPLSEETRNEERRTILHYNSNGTGFVRIYADAACTKLKFTGPFSWTVHHGVMITRIPNGNTSTDKFVSIQSRAMTLRFIGGGFLEEFLEHRVKADTCARGSLLR